MEDFFHWVSKAILEYWILICIVLGTSGMALMRTAKQNGKADYFAINYLTREMIKNLFDHCEKSA